MLAQWLILLLVGTTGVGVLLRAFMLPGDRVLALFSDTYSVPIRAENRDIVARYIRWSRASRFAGAAVAASGSAVVVVFFGPERQNVPGYVAMGYGLGAGIGELVRRRPPVAARATLTPRTLTNFLAPWLVWSLRSVMILAFGGLALSARFDHGVASFWVIRSRSTVLAVAAAFLIVGLLAWAMMRRIVAAPQPASDLLLEATQHAIRSASLMSMAGVALMSAGGALLFELALLYEVWPAATSGLLNAVWAGVGLLGSCLGYFLSLRSLPRYAAVWRKIPVVAS